MSILIMFIVLMLVFMTVIVYFVIVGVRVDWLNRLIFIVFTEDRSLAVGEQNNVVDAGQIQLLRRSSGCREKWLQPGSQPGTHINYQMGFL